MKNIFKGMGALALAFAISIGSADAQTASRKIDTSTCETVYTNYYFFLEANTTGYFNNRPLSSITTNNIAGHNNNSYMINNFDKNNIGYGQVELSSTSKTSSDGITSMSLNDYYTYYLRAVNANGAFSEGTKTVIASHDWYSVDNYGNKTLQSGGLGVGGASRIDLINASLNANSTMTRLSIVDPANPNPLDIRIDRTYTGYLTGMPVKIGSYDWYFQPAVYYVQYCSPVRNNISNEFTIEYDGNGSNVSNVPSTQYGYNNECLRISNVTPTREGYRFLGWSTDASATTANSKYSAGREYCEGKSIILHAIWEKISPIGNYYHVYYKSNTTDAVSNMPGDVTVNDTNDIYIANNIPVRNGYTFLGWSTDANSPVANTAYNGGTLYTDRKDITLYAIWQKKTEVLPPNPQTGIEDYLLPFGGIVSAAGLTLNVLKKKKGFKQF